MINQIPLSQGERAIIVNVNGSREFKNYLLTNGISLGTVLVFNYSPRFSKLVNLSVGTKMICLRRKDFTFLEWVKI